MGKHSYEDLGPREIMSCTRVFPRGIGFDHCGPVETITITRDVHSDNNVFATGMVPLRPTGAHRFEAWEDALLEFVPARTAADFRRQYA